ncbi:MAG TPA: DinB family protein [Vicinamibacterales bacterium]|nr:DinB family protein [Vicinamibacterales bacterium]
MSIFTNPASSTPADVAAYVAGLLDLLGDKDPVLVLRQTPAALEQFLAAVPAQNLTTPEAPGKWSVCEVVQHLADSELVGGFRLRMVMSHDRPLLTGYDQDRWASRLRYRDADVRDALEQFTVLRRANVRIWQRLSPADLARVGLHGERGEESLEQLRRLYAGHDLLHLRQLERIRASQGLAPRTERT